MLAKEEGEKSSELKKQAENGNVNTGEQISAADYDPSLDRREDEGKRVLPPVKVEEEIEEIEIEEEEEDDVDDMFAVATSDKKPKVKRVKKIAVRIIVLFLPDLVLISLLFACRSPAFLRSSPLLWTLRLIQKDITQLYWESSLMVEDIKFSHLSAKACSPMLSGLVYSYLNQTNPVGGRLLSKLLDAKNPCTNDFLPST